MVIPSNSPPAADLIAALSHPRLSNYRRFFRTASDQELLGVYQWNEDLSTSLFRTISLVEIVLRNQFHRALSGKYGVNGSAASKDWYLHLALSPESLKKINKVARRKAGLVPKPDDVVSKLTFGFWPRMLDVQLDTAGTAVQWGHLLPVIVPGHRYLLPTYWSRLAHQDELFARLDLVNELRNRIAHHEPIWKLGQLLHETRERPKRPRGVAAGAPSTPADALSRLLLLYERVLELLGWLSPQTHKAFRGSETDARCRMLLTERALNHYRARRPLAEVELSQFNGPQKMRKLLKYAARHRQPLHLVQAGASLGHWICPG